jgi:hypothetical protein
VSSPAENGAHCADKEETQSGDLIHPRSHGELSFVQKMGPPLADMLWAKLIGRFAKVTGERDFRGFGRGRRVTTVPMWLGKHEHSWRTKSEYDILLG